MKIIDDFVRDPKLLEAMQNTHSDFWAEGYSWWHSSSPAITLRHRLIDYIWLQGRNELPENVAGFEHWAGIYDASGKRSFMELVDQTDSPHVQPDRHGSKKFSLIHHVDKDEAYWAANEGKIISPELGCIYYPIQDQECKGGYLRIYDAPAGDVSEAFKKPYELIAPKANRLIIFYPGILHAVEEVTEGIRFAIAINLWRKPLSAAQMNEMIDIV